MATKGDITLDGKDYRLDMATYRARDIVDFAPRSATPGGSVVMSDLSLWQPLMMTDWRHGFGHQWYADALGYLRTDGNIDTRHDGLAMMFTQSVSSDTDDALRVGFTNFNGKWYSIGDSGLREYNGTSWSDKAGGAIVNCIFNNGDYLYFGPESARLQKMDTAGTITDAGLDANSADWGGLIRHRGFIFAWIEDTNQIHFDKTSGLAALDGQDTDANMILVGTGDVPIIWAKVFDGNLYIGKQDGVWHLGEDGIARLLVDQSRELSASNLLSGEVVNGFLTFPVRDRIIQWNGARVSDVSPQRISDVFPYITYGSYDHFVVTDNLLYVIGTTTHTTPEHHLIAFDGVSWHKLAELSNGLDIVTGMNYDVVNNRLWYHISATPDVTYYFSFKSNSEFPFENFPTSGTHSLISSRLDMGFRRITKSMDSIWIEATGLSDTVYLTVLYEIDNSGTWVTWGDVKEDGVTTLKFPGNLYTQEFNHIKIRIDFTTDTATLSPILEGATIRFMLRPDVVFGYNFDIIASSNQAYGQHADKRTSAAIATRIRELRDSKSPIDFIDLLGNTVKVYVSSINEIAQVRTASKSEGKFDVEYRLNINLVGV